jgi:hypothetical protein
MFESSKPMLEISQAIIRFAALHSRLELFAKGGRPLCPRKVPLRGQLHSNRKRLRLPWFRKHWASRVVGQKR